MPAGQALTDPLTGQAVTQIVWADEDALPFPLCLSAQTESAMAANLSITSAWRAANRAGGPWNDDRRREPGRSAERTVGQTAGVELRALRTARSGALPVRFRPELSARPLTFATPNRSVSLFGFTAAAQDATISIIKYCRWICRSNSKPRA